MEAIIFLEHKVCEVEIDVIENKVALILPVLHATSFQRFSNHHHLYFIISSETSKRESIMEQARVWNIIIHKTARAESWKFQPETFLIPYQDDSN